MSDTYESTIAGLVRKRSTLACEVAATRDKLTPMMADLDHIDAAIRILDPSAVGVMDSEPNVRNKLARGKFTAVF